ncbi:MAG: hypothetical protein GF411_17930 [Candidatus Lokiarchaeota archaeon]|nr:hypothetical protein [Candidatus Lokiarchaeota archaeon]
MPYPQLHPEFVYINPDSHSSCTVVLMGLTLLYQPHKRNEDQLTNWFLAVLEKIDIARRKALFCKLGFDKLKGLDCDFIIHSQETLDHGRIDGLLIGDEIVIGFESKVKSEHDAASGKSSQLRKYYDDLKTRYKNRDIRLLVTADQTSQSKKDILSVLAKQGVPKESVDIMLWQDLHRALSSLIESDKSTKSDSIPNSCEQAVSTFLFKETKRILEKMKMNSFSGIKNEDISGYLSVRSQLFNLEPYIASLVKNIDELDKKQSGHLAFENLEFRSKKWKSKVILAFKMKPDGFKIYFRVHRKGPLPKISMKVLDYEEFVESLKKTEEGYSVYGLVPEECDFTLSDIEKKYSGKDRIDLYGRFQISKTIPYEDLQDSREFTAMLKREVESLKGVISLLHETIEDAE